MSKKYLENRKKYMQALGTDVTQQEIAKSAAEDRQKYMRAWTEKMVEIWRERIQRLDIIDTQHLYNDFSDEIVGDISSITHTIKHHFMFYGLYQDVGVGRGYTPDNGGYLEMLDPTSDKYTKKPRKPREWFSRAYYVSVKVLNEQMAHMYGEEFAGLISNAIRYSDEVRGSSLRSKLWGKHGSGG